MVLSSSEKGKTRLRVIPVGMLIEVKEKVRRYRNVRKARARLIKVQKEILRVVDKLEALRMVETG
jgi:hypothetical protein